MSAITTQDLELHRLWLADNTAGRRLERANSDLSYSNLYGSNLSGSDLSGSDLRGSNLHGSDLHGSNLYGSNLRGSSLSYSNLRAARGVLCLPIHDPRGYRCVAVWHSDGWRIASGCRWFGVGEAREHWGANYSGDRAIGDAYLAALDWLAHQQCPQVVA